MKLSNEFVVAAPIEQTWKALLGVPGGGWRGTIGDYEGTARIQDIDDDECVATFRAVTSDGTAVATVTSRLASDDRVTRVLVETDVRATSQVDPPSVEAALQQLSKQLEREALAQRDADPDPQAAAESPPPAAAAAGGQARTDRMVLVGIALLVALVLAAIVRGGRR